MMHLEMLKLRLLVWNCMALLKLLNIHTDINVIMKASGLMTLVVLEMKLEFHNANILLGEPIIVIGKLNAFNYSVEQEDLKFNLKPLFHCLLISYFKLPIMEKKEEFVTMPLIQTQLKLLA